MTKNSVPIPDVLLNNECPKCGHPGYSLPTIYRHMIAPGWECMYCGYTWLRHNDLNRIVVINREVSNGY